MQKETEATARIGLFGGTFNPVHMGHIRSAEEVREQFSLSKMLFIPAHIPPHKKTPVIASEHRLEMVRLAVANNPFFEVSDIELKREGSSYSSETIDFFREHCGPSAELFFIMGLDAFRDISTWKHYPRFFSTCNFIVMGRPEVRGGAPFAEALPADALSAFTLDDKNNCYRHKSGNRICFCSITLLDISSTAIRKRLQQKRSVRYLVDDQVVHYIKEHGLYEKL